MICWRREVLEAPTFQAARGLCVADLAGTGDGPSNFTINFFNASDLQFLDSCMLCWSQRERERARGCIPTEDLLRI